MCGVRCGILSAVAVAGLAVWVAATLWPGCSETSYAGRVAVVTGATGDIGGELARQLAAAGAALVLTGRRESLLQKVANEATELGAEGVAIVPGDISDPAVAQRVISTATEQFGGIDLLILNHAKVDSNLTVEYESPEALASTLRGVLDVNVVSSARLALLAMPALEARAGRIAISSSGAAKFPTHFHSSYSASKRALHGFFDTMRAELLATNRGHVSISVIVLGMIQSGEIMSHPALRERALPVTDCARSMLCAIEAREREPVIPRYIGLVLSLDYLFPGVAEVLARRMYLSHLPSFLGRLSAASLPARPRR